MAGNKAGRGGQFEREERRRVRSGGGETNLLGPERLVVVQRRRFDEVLEMGPDRRGSQIGKKSQQTRRTSEESTERDET